jgi:pimeloyl-ACP methyl ester carboxylesterase
MNTLPRYLRIVVIMLMLSLLPHAALAQEGRQPTEAAAWLRETLRYYRLADKATAQDREKLLELRAKFLAPQLGFSERLSVCAEIYEIFLPLLGGGAVPPPIITRGCLLPTQITQGVVTHADYQTLKLSTTPLGALGHVEKMGRGPIPLILVPDYGTDWTFYRSFMERNRDRYTMYAVTLPGFGGTPAPPKPAFYDPAATPWWDGAEQSLLSLIAKHKLDRPVVVGTQIGAYLATRLALNHPKNIRGAVGLNDLVSMPLLTSDNPNARLSWSERQRLIAGRPDLMGLLAEFRPQVRLTPAAAEQTLSQMPPQVQQYVLGLNTRKAERGKSLYLEFMARTDPRSQGYLNELIGADLTDGLKKLQVPLLVIPSLHDDKSPGRGGPALSQWQEIKQQSPAIPLTLAPFENTRNYAVEEAPEALDRAIAAFVAGTSAEVKRVSKRTQGELPKLVK